MRDLHRLPGENGRVWEGRRGGGGGEARRIGLGWGILPDGRDVVPVGDGKGAGRLAGWHGQVAWGGSEGQTFVRIARERDSGREKAITSSEVQCNHLVEKKTTSILLYM